MQKLTFGFLGVSQAIMSEKESQERYEYANIVDESEQIIDMELGSRYTVWFFSKYQIWIDLS